MAPNTYSYLSGLLVLQVCPLMVRQPLDYHGDPQNPIRRTALIGESAKYLEEKLGETPCLGERIKPSGVFRHINWTAVLHPLKDDFKKRRSDFEKVDTCV